ncbi:hypothetical protein ACTMU2_31610 [Cupriavidus basilensis]
MLAKAKRSGRGADYLRQIAAQTGKATFDGMIANKKFARENPDFMVKFVRVLAAADDNYRNNKAAWTPDSAPIKSVARLTGAKAEEVGEHWRSTASRRCGSRPRRAGSAAARPAHCARQRSS